MLISIVINRIYINKSVINLDKSWQTKYFISIPSLFFVYSRNITTQSQSASHFSRFHLKNKHKMMFSLKNITFQLLKILKNEIYIIYFPFRLGVMGNTLVVLSIIQHKVLQSVRNMFILSLSITDIVISIVSGTITPITAFTKIWLFGEFLCYLVPLIQVWFG